MTKFKTQDVLAVAYAAYRKNDGYLKDTFRFSEPTNETAFSNKDLVKFQMVPEYRPDDFKPLSITEDDYKGVEDALRHFRRYTLGILADNLNNFQQDVIDSVLVEDVPSNKLGILAYVPELVSREIKENTLKKTLRTVYRDSNYVGEIKQPFEGVVCVLAENFVANYEKFVYTCDYMGNIVSFWSSYELKAGDRRRIRGKVKSHIKNRLFDVNETQLNYVKMYKV